LISARRCSISVLTFKSKTESGINEILLAAYESAIAGRDYQSTLLKQIGESEKHIAQLEARDAEAETYQLA